MSCNVFKPTTPMRTKIGVVVTAVYLLLLALLIYSRWLELINLKLNELGDLAAGAFGPLAIMWLILGYMQQGEELKQNTDALRLQAVELANTVQQQKALVALGQQQLEREREVLQEERDARSKAARPKFSFSIIDYEIAVNGWNRWRISVKNLGPSCSNLIAIEITSKVFFSTLQDLTEGQLWSVDARCRISDDPESFEFYLAYSDVSGNLAKQKVTVLSLAEGRSYRVFGEDDAELEKMKNETNNS